MALVVNERKGSDYPVEGVVQLVDLRDRHRRAILSSAAKKFWSVAAASSIEIAGELSPASKRPRGTESDARAGFAETKRRIALRHGVEWSEKGLFKEAPMAALSIYLL